MFLIYKVFIRDRDSKFKFSRTKNRVYTNYVSCFYKTQTMKMGIDRTYLEFASPGVGHARIRTHFSHNVLFLQHTGGNIVAKRERTNMVDFILIFRRPRKTTTFVSCG